MDRVIHWGNLNSWSSTKVFLNQCIGTEKRNRLRSPPPFASRVAATLVENTTTEQPTHPKMASPPPSTPNRSTYSAIRRPNNNGNSGVENSEALLLALEELYLVCQEQHQHYSDLLLEYQSKTLEFEGKCKTSKLDMEQAKLRLEQYGRKLKLESARKQLEQADQLLGVGATADENDDLPNLSSMFSDLTSDVEIDIQNTSNNHIKEIGEVQNLQTDVAAEQSPDPEAPPAVSRVRSFDSFLPQPTPTKQLLKGKKPVITPNKRSKLPKYSPIRTNTKNDTEGNLLVKANPYSPSRSSRAASSTNGAANTPSKSPYQAGLVRPKQNATPTPKKSDTSPTKSISPQANFTAWSPTVASLPTDTTAGWLKMLSKANKFYRIRSYVTKAKRSPDDPFGRTPALWSLQTNQILSSVNEVIYNKTPGSNAKVTVVCRYFNSTPCPVAYNKTQWAMDWEFCKLSAGDIVCLILPGPKPEVCFGVVEGHAITMSFRDGLTRKFGAGIFPTHITSKVSASRRGQDCLLEDSIFVLTHTSCLIIYLCDVTSFCCCEK